MSNRAEIILDRSDDVQIKLVALLFTSFFNPQTSFQNFILIKYPDNDTWMNMDSNDNIFNYVTYADVLKLNQHLLSQAQIC